MEEILFGTFCIELALGLYAWAKSSLRETVARYGSNKM